MTSGVKRNLQMSSFVTAVIELNSNQSHHCYNDNNSNYCYFPASVIHQ